MKQATQPTAKLTFKTTQDSNKTFKLEGSVESIQWTAQYLKSHCNVYDVVIVQNAITLFV